MDAARNVTRNPHPPSELAAFYPVKMVERGPSRNLWETNAPTADLVPAGAWNCRTVLSFATESSANPGSHHVSETAAANALQIQATTIDETVSGLELSRLDYVKMDIEGAEVRPLEGARQTIRKFRPRMVIATEHTSDIVANTRSVIETLKSIEPSYRYKVTESQMDWSTLRVVPYTLDFQSTISPRR